MYSPNSLSLRSKVRCAHSHYVRDMFTVDSLYSILSYSRIVDQSNVKRVSTLFKSIIQRLKRWGCTTIIKYYNNHSFLLDIKPNNDVSYRKEYSKNQNKCCICNRNTPLPYTALCVICSCQEHYKPIPLAFTYLFRIVDCYSYIDIDRNGPSFPIFRDNYILMWRCRMCKEILYYNDQERIEVLHSLFVRHIIDGHKLT